MRKLLLAAAITLGVTSAHACTGEMVQYKASVIAQEFAQCLSDGPASMDTANRWKGKANFKMKELAYECNLRDPT